MQNQIAFIALESVPIAAAVICLTTFHPGLLFLPNGSKEGDWALLDKSVDYETRDWAESVTGKSSEADVKITAPEPTYSPSQA